MYLASTLCLGHARYSTSGPYNVELQPIVLGDMALVFNGTIANYRELARIMRGEGLEVANEHYDTWVLAMYLGYLLTKHGVEDAIRRLFMTVKGGYAIIAIWKGQLLLIRDPWGIRPLSVGFNEDGIAAASETSALEVLGIRWRELEPGKAVVFNSKGDVNEYYADGVRSNRRAYCALEYIYFMRPDSFFNGISVYSVRQRLGLSLARKEPIKDIDVVTPIPESARVAAQSYARALGRPMEDLVVKNRFLGRNFIKPPMERNGELYGIVREVRDKSLALIDDSIIRGDTLRSLIPRLRRYGARAIHVRVSSPPIRYPCFMGMDFPTRRELIAHGRTIDGIREILGADSLIYLTVDELLWSIGVDEVCTACFTGNYPFDVNIDELERDFTR